MTIARFDHTLHTLSVIVLLLFSLGACSAGTPSTTISPRASVPAAKHPSPTSIPLPAGIVLYQAHWSHGLIGWPDAHGWKVVQGRLESNSSGSATFTIPYRPTVSDYAIEVRIQVVRSVPPNSGYFLISAAKSPGKDGYHAGILDLKGSASRPFGDHPQSQVYLDPTDDMPQGSGIPQDYEPGSGWHTYRIEVQGNEVSLLDNGVQIGSASSDVTDALSNGPIGFSSELVILRVSSLRILTL